MHSDFAVHDASYICLLYSWRLIGWLHCFMHAHGTRCSTRKLARFISVAFNPTLPTESAHNRDIDGFLAASRVAMEGYAKLAQLMATHEEFAILRRFKTLNYQNLLYLQAEIVHLEQELAKLVNRDLAHLDRGDFAKDWWTLAHANGAEAQQQWKKILKIRKKLGKYSKNIILLEP